MEENSNLLCQEVISICDSIDQIVYIADPDTYEILFVNKALKKSLGEVVGKKCYAAFQGLDSPCPFCTNKYIFGENLGKTYIWDFQNRNDKRWYHCVDKAIRWPDGRWVRYEMAIDVTERKIAEQTLQESELKFRVIFDRVFDAIIMIDQDGKIVNVNEAASRLLGYSKDEFLKMSIKDLHTEEELARVQLALNRLLKTGTDLTEVNFIDKHGKSISVELGGVTLSIDGKRYFAGSFRDITERKRSELVLQEERDKARRYIDIAAVMIVAIDVEGRVMLINEKGCEILGYSQEEIIGKSWFDNFVPERLREKVKSVGKRLFSGEIEPLEYFENSVLTKNGEERIIAWHNSVLRDEEGRIVFSLSSGEDITERKKIEEALNKGKQFLSNIFSSIQDGICVLDTQMKIVRVNSIMEKWYAHAMPLVGKYCYEAYHLRNKNCDICPVVDTLKTGQKSFKLVPKMGEKGKATGWLELYSFPLIDEATGKIEGIIEYVRDITERKFAEKEKEKSDKEVLKSNKRLKRLALRDQLTGLFNHRYFQDVIEREFDRAKRNGHNLSLIMLDLDYFKSINDVYGHLFGDLVLKQFAVQIKRMVRGYDIVVRYGGEEFVIVCPTTARPSALVLAQRMQEAINLYNFGNNKNTVKLKLSLAVASYPEDHILNGMDLVKLTDHILSKAKESGGNRVYCSLDIKKEKQHALENGAKSADVKFLKEKLDKLTKRANQSLIEATFAFAKTIDLKDHYTGEHVEKTVHYATEIANLLGLPRNDVELVKQASILHDLGKIGVSEKILLKKSKLTKEEFEEVKKHPRIGVEIIRPIHFLHSIVPLILYHHERWDGKGYPYGLKGEEIPVGARIIAIADVYQALISDRPYHKAYSENEAVGIIKKGSGTQFDPHIVITFLRILKQKK
jgi:diguanylate cyclase (GGDEF)-like protein/PAS domain S-box-containing protein